MSSPWRSVVLIVPLVCLIGGGACGRSPAGPARDLPADLVVADPPHLFRSLQGGIARELRSVIRSQPDWEAFWRDLVAGGADVPPQPPAVDFREFVVVVAALGTRERAGYDIAVVAYRRVAGATTVTILKTAPPTACPTGPVLTAPLAIAAVAAGAISFQELEAEAPCPSS